MKIAKAAAGVVGVALALGAASPALAASGPHGEKALTNSDTVTKNDVKNPLAGLDIDGLVSSVDKVAGKLKTPNSTHAKTHSGDQAKTAHVAHHPKTHSGGHAKTAHVGDHAKTHSAGHGKAGR
ncbi:DUF4179 domain-containing protein [Streptomyces natalensis]|uniref:Secreted protein n=1 Tax=Streptomyces natalensis ATCC 27448 TaxID=1240678 RepID=A0A0D7CIN5_9ACTN|nr:DUF4179 domain-containing protein [Streptomyces natalensis]KIZ16124.1 hypothetical protein SNA_23205 [Streptomyces natalensis ATCC 27448]